MAGYYQNRRPLYLRALLRTERKVYRMRTEITFNDLLDRIVADGIELNAMRKELDRLRNVAAERDAKQVYLTASLDREQDLRSDIAKLTDELAAVKRQVMIITQIDDAVDVLDGGPAPAPPPTVAQLWDRGRM